MDCVRSVLTPGQTAEYVHAAAGLRKRAGLVVHTSPRLQPCARARTASSPLMFHASWPRCCCKRDCGRPSGRLLRLRDSPRALELQLRLSRREGPTCRRVCNGRLHFGAEAVGAKVYRCRRLRRPARKLASRNDSRLLDGPMASVASAKADAPVPAHHCPHCDLLAKGKWLLLCAHARQGRHQTRSHQQFTIVHQTPASVRSKRQKALHVTAAVDSGQPYSECKAVVDGSRAEDCQADAHGPRLA